MAASLTSLSPAEMQAALAGPAAAPPLGVTTHIGFPNPFSVSVIVMVIISQVVSSSCLAMRLLAQYFVSHGLVTEDYLFVVASLFHLAADVTGAVSATPGSGQHMWDMTLSNYIQTTKVVYFYALLYVGCISLIKIVIVLQFIRILAPKQANKTGWMICWATIAIIAIFYGINFFLLIFPCTPIDKYWNLFQKGHCLSSAWIYFSSPVFELLTDLIIFVIPIPIIWRLNMKPRRKIAVLAVFATGILAIVASTMHLFYTYEVFFKGDPTYYEMLMGVWCTIEMVTGTIIFCAPQFTKFCHLLRTTILARVSSVDLSHPSIEGASPHEVQVVMPNPSKKETYQMPSLMSFEVRDASRMTFAASSTSAGKSDHDSSKTDSSE